MTKYIDAAKMIVELFKGTMVTDDLFGMGKAEGIEFAARKIQQAPAADVVEVRHGRWKRKESVKCYWHECSACGERPAEKYGNDYFSDYCPNCGAKMDEEDE